MTDSHWAIIAAAAVVAYLFRDELLGQINNDVDLGEWGHEDY